MIPEHWWTEVKIMIPFTLYFAGAYKPLLLRNARTYRKAYENALDLVNRLQFEVQNRNKPCITYKVGRKNIRKEREINDEKVVCCYTCSVDSIMHERL